MAVPMLQPLTNAVCLTPMMLNIHALTVRRVFFKHWQPRARWTVSLGDNNQVAPFSCDRHRGVITLSQIDFASRDDLRAALITQFALAMSTARQEQLERAVAIELRRTASTARQLHQLTLEQSLLEMLQRLESGEIRIDHDSDSDLVHTHAPFPTPSGDALLCAWITSVSDELEREFGDEALHVAHLSSELVLAKKPENLMSCDPQA